jgi:hypothetical protein
MIKPNEIRIGNYVNVIDKIDKVTGVSIRLRPDCGYYSFENFHAELKGIHLTPIPLTEDILLKCGIAYGQPKEPYKEGLIYYCKDEHLLMITGTEYNEPISLIKVKYLHEVQNIIYWYTGEELNINI